MPHPTLKITVAAALALASLLSLTPDADATGIITRRPNLTDHACRVVQTGSTEAASLRTVQITGRTEGMTSAPGGPVNHIIRPLRQRMLQVRRVGCEHPEPRGFVKAGTCDSLPRYRWSGHVPKGHAYEVLHEGFVIGTIGVADPQAPLSCPAPPPAPYDVWTDLPGSGVTTTVQVKRADIDVLDTTGGYGGPSVTIEVDAVRGVARDSDHMHSAFAVALGLTPDELLGKGPTVAFEATVTRKRHRYDEIDDTGPRDVVHCVQTRYETVELRRPGVSTVWSFNSGFMEHRTPGRCR